MKILVVNAGSSSLKCQLIDMSYEILHREVKKGFAPARIFNCERAFLAKLRCMRPADFLQIADVTEGMENKIYKSV